MENYFWDTQIDYLKWTRTQMWNDDYFEFLVKSVWKFDKPINIIDFGCGYGYLGLKLLPLLPTGSTYTGLDLGEALLSEARRIYENSPYKTEFINVDLTGYTPVKQYDLAICQAVLRHIPSSKAILEKMVDSVTSGGMVICIEVNRAMEESGFYTNVYEHDSIEKTALFKQQWDKELQDGGRDYKLGIKVPMYMQQLGLNDVNARINDFVEFVSPLTDEKIYKQNIDNLFRSKGIQPAQNHDIENIEDAESIFAFNARCLVISYGRK